VQYQLDLSAGKPSNLLPDEFALGTLPGYYSSPESVIRTGSISGLNTSDIYSFTSDFGDSINVSLSGLSSDADVRLIKDINGNKILDRTDEVLRSSALGGTQSETINYGPLGGDPPISGDYLVQIYQFSGDTNYTLTLTPYLSIG
jgi:hypothetical protein